VGRKDVAVPSAPTKRLALAKPRDSRRVAVGDIRGSLVCCARGPDEERRLGSSDPDMELVHGRGRFCDLRHKESLSKNRLPQIQKTDLFSILSRKCGWKQGLPSPAAQLQRALAVFARVHSNREVTSAFGRECWPGGQVWAAFRRSRAYFFAGMSASRSERTVEVLSAPIETP